MRCPAYLVLVLLMMGCATVAHGHRGGQREEVESAEEREPQQHRDVSPRSPNRKPQPRCSADGQCQAGSSMPWLTLSEAGMQAPSLNEHSNAPERYPWGGWAENHTVLEQIHCGLASGRVVIIRNATTRAALEAIRESTRPIPDSAFFLARDIQKQASHETLQETFQRTRKAGTSDICQRLQKLGCQKFQFAHSNLPLVAANRKDFSESFAGHSNIVLPPSQRAAFRFYESLSTRASLDFFGALIGVRREFRDTLYMQGVCVVRYHDQHFSCPHNDAQEERLVAFILYLTDSEPGDGGEFIWCNPSSIHAPVKGSPQQPSKRSFMFSLHGRHICG